ncbi:hypothetical protein GF391_02245 [Candidatus Uhrbacteria bacterium]|nr:hypothetical protein [Candidatus Uhrbacteria bacterium]
MQRQWKTLIIIIAIIISIVFLHVTRVLVPFEEAFRGVLAPLGALVSKVGITVHDQAGNVGVDAQCKDRIDELERRIEHLSVDYVQLNALKEENAVLRKTLGFEEQQGYELVIANIISRSVVPNRGFFTIDRGSKDGVELGMAVIFGEGIYVGKVTRIYERTSLVTLTTDPASRVAISKPGEHTLIGLVEGDGNRVAKATLIPQDEVISQNDVLVTSGTEEKIPPDLIVGIVNQVIDQTTDPFKEAVLEPVVQTDYLSIVAVLMPKVLNPEN